MNMVLESLSLLGIISTHQRMESTYSTSACSKKRGELVWILYKRSYKSWKRKAPQCTWNIWGAFPW